MQTSSFEIHGWAVKPYQKITRCYRYWRSFSNSFAIRKKERKKERKENPKKWEKTDEIVSKLQKLFDKI